MACFRLTRHNAHVLFALLLVMCVSFVAVTSVTPSSLAGVVAQPAHAGSHKGQGTSGGLDSFQTGMIIGFVAFAVLALCMMLLILYFLVRGTRRELRKAQVELAELREQRRQDMAAERLQLHVKGRTSELRCIVDDEYEDDSSDLVKDENDQDDQYIPYEYDAPPSPSYDNYTYVTMGTQRDGPMGRKKAKTGDFIIEN